MNFKVENMSSSESEQDNLDVSPGRLRQASSTTDPSSTSPYVVSSAQKRRRVARACDECRRKKIKCDGKRPCTHCTVYSYDCTYDQPSNRRRNPAPQQYIEELESRLHRAETIIRSALPHVDLDDPTLDLARLRSRPEARPRPGDSRGGEDKGAGSGDDLDTDALMESMVETTGQLDIDDRGYLDYHGHSSGLSFMRRMRKQYGDLFGEDSRSGPFVLPDGMPKIHRSPKSPFSDDATPLALEPLPSKAVARTLVSNALDDGCTLIRFVHQPTFYAMMDRLYSNSPDAYGDEENRFLPLLYVVLSFGCLFAKDEHSDLEKGGYVCAITQGFKYYDAGRQMIDITDCRDLPSLQALIFMILFLQSSARLTTCYSYIGIALRSALRMGLHRSVARDFNPIERETRKQVFWVIHKLDMYVGAMLGMPKSLSDKDIDQEYPAEVDDEYITEHGILPMPEGTVSLVAGANAQNDLVRVLTKVIKYIYPIKGSEKRRVGPDKRSYVVSYARVREIEQDLQAWMNGLPDYLLARESPSPEHSRIQHLLRLTYSFLQMMLYRPFVHYVSRTGSFRKTDRRAYACAVACVGVCRNLIHITTQMKGKGLLMGAYWFVMYTTFSSIVTLVFFVLENLDDPASVDVLRDAQEGKQTLARLSKRSLAADRCTHTLDLLFAQLPERLRQDNDGEPASNKKRRVTTPGSSESATPSIKTDSSGVKQEPPSPASFAAAFPSPARNKRKPAKPLLAQDQPASSAASIDAGFPGLAHEQAASSDSSAIPTPATQPDPIGAASQPPATNAFLLQQQPSVNDFFNFNAMMFPSPDPFAYPNNPITILEDQQHQHQQQQQCSLGSAASAAMDGGNNIMFMQDPMSNGGAYDNVEVQLLDPLPPYLEQNQVPLPTAPTSVGQQTSDGAVFGSAYGAPTGNPAAQHPGFNLDDLFGGNDWSSSHLSIGLQNQQDFSG